MRMLTDFFQLNACANLKKFGNGTEFCNYFANSKSLQNAELVSGARVQQIGFKEIEFDNVKLSHVVFERVMFTR